MARRGRENPISTLGASYKDAYDDIRADWRIGKTGKFTPRPKGISTTGTNADYHFRNQSDFLLAMERARDWDRNNLVVPAGINRVVDNVMGSDGPQLTPETSDEGFNREAKERFYSWADDPNFCDVTGEDTFWEMSSMMFRSCLVDGDGLGIPLIDGQLQTIEAHRLRTPSNTKQNCVLGVLLDGVGKPLEYWITKEDVGIFQAIKLVGDMKKIPARDELGRKQVFHPRMRSRLSQTRGVTPLAPAADAIGIHDDLQFATLVKAQVAACFAIIRQLEGGGDNKPIIPPRGAASDTQLGVRDTSTRSDSSTETTEQIGPAMDVRGKPGEKISMQSANIPNPEFFPHATLILTFISINLGLPLAVLLLDPSKTNFSGWRGAVDQARQGFKRLQTRFASQWFSPIYEWKMRQFAADDPIFARRIEQLGSIAFKHKWQSPGWDYIQPQQDAQADLLKAAGCLESMTSIHAKRNRNWGEVSTEIVNDNAMLIFKAKQKADDLNQQLGLSGAEAITWREVASLPLPQGMTVRLDASPQNEQPQTTGSAA